MVLCGLQSVGTPNVLNFISSKKYAKINEALAGRWSPPLEEASGWVGWVGVGCPTSPRFKKSSDATGGQNGVTRTTGRVRERAKCGRKGLTRSDLEFPRGGRGQESVRSRPIARQGCRRLWPHRRRVHPAEHRRLWGVQGARHCGGKRRPLPSLQRREDCFRDEHRAHQGTCRADLKGQCWGEGETLMKLAKFQTSFLSGLHFPNPIWQRRFLFPLPYVHPRHGVDIHRHCRLGCEMYVKQAPSLPNHSAFFC